MWFAPGSNSNNRKMCLLIFNMDIITVSWINGVDFCQWICMECFFLFFSKHAIAREMDVNSCYCFKH